jgi:hypothetical protein
MSANNQTPKPKKQRPRPPRTLRAKTGVSSLKVKGKLDLGLSCLSAHAQAAPALAAKVAPQAAQLQQNYDTYVTKLGERKQLGDQVVVKDAEVASAARAFNGSLEDYQTGALRASNEDATVLKMLGGTPVSAGYAKVDRPPAAPTNVRIVDGPTYGSGFVKHRRPAGAASFAVEYKLEPSLPEDPWISSETLQSKAASHLLDGFSPAQLIRVRVRALGCGWGDYSVEVVGRLK